MTDNITRTVILESNGYSFQIELKRVNNLVFGTVYVLKTHEKIGIASVWFNKEESCWKLTNIWFTYFETEQKPRYSFVEDDTAITLRIISRLPEDVDQLEQAYTEFTEATRLILGCEEVIKILTEYLDNSFKG